MTQYVFANLESSDLNKIKALEERLGSPLVAMRPVELPAADLEADALDQVRSLEQSLGVTLLAVDNDPNNA